MAGGVRRRSALAVALAAVLLVAGCGAASTGSRSVTPAAAPPEMASPGEAGPASDSGGVADESSTDSSARSKAAAGTAGSNKPGAAAVALVPRDLVITGTLTVKVKDVTAAAARARTLATQLGGVVAAERITGAADSDEQNSAGKSRDNEGWPSAQLTLRIPTDRADEAMDRLADLGTLADRDLTSEDVTAQVVDVASRVATARASVERVRALLEQAKTLGEVVQIESELTRRQADLESLEAQRKRLADLTELATVTTTFVPTSAQVAAPADDGGFLGGLRAGWSAFVAAAQTGLTVLGATLPFLVLVALVGVPVLVLRRRSRRAPAEPSEDGTPA